MATALGEAISFRFVTMVGGGAMALAFFLCTWAPSVEYVVGVLGGLVGKNRRVLVVDAE